MAEAGPQAAAAGVGGGTSGPRLAARVTAFLVLEFEPSIPSRGICLANEMIG